MYPMWIAAIFGAILSLLTLVWQPTGRSAYLATGSADVVANAMGMYHTAAESWAAKNPGASGYVSSASLSLPSTWRSVAGIQSYRSGEYLVTWYAGTASPATAVAVALEAKNAYEIGVGVASRGYVVSPRGSVLPVPSLVPEGAAVKVTKLY
jgi:hypothetical protein